MKQSDFEHNMHGAKQISELSEEPHDHDYWCGYQRGLRRHHHGEKFGTAEEHALWMAAAGQTRDEQRRHRGLGYRAGFDGMSISDAIKHLAKFTAASLAGSARSEVKTLSSRENARRPRPNALGKSKPRKKDL